MTVCTWWVVSAYSAVHNDEWCLCCVWGRKEQEQDRRTSLVCSGAAVLYVAGSFFPVSTPLVLWFIGANHPLHLSRFPGSPHCTGETTKCDRNRLPIGYFQLETVGKVLGGSMRLSLWNAEVIVFGSLCNTVTVDRSFAASASTPLRPRPLPRSPIPFSFLHPLFFLLSLFFACSLSHTTTVQVTGIIHTTSGAVSFTVLTHALKDFHAVNFKGTGGERGVAWRWNPRQVRRGVWCAFVILWWLQPHERGMQHIIHYSHFTFHQ